MSSEEPKEAATYECGCHCGYIAFAVTLSPPLPEYKILECNCSICRRAGYLLVCMRSLLFRFSYANHINTHTHKYIYPCVASFESGRADQ